MPTKLKGLPPLVRAAETRVIKAERKWTDPFYASEPYLKWRAGVIAKSGGRCQAIVDGMRCDKAQPKHRLFADHIIERRDGGPDLDPRNGQALCGEHHTLKTVQQRAARLSGQGGA